jgi:putative serine protease PepD
MSKRKAPALSAALVAAFLLLASFPAFALSLPSLLAASPRIETEGGHGSGVVIAPGVILTAYHVVKRHRFISADFANGKSYPATLRARIGDDLAVLTFDGPRNSRIAKLACRPVIFGERILAIGNPINIQNAIMFGYVMSETPSENLIALNLPEMPGMSGGPVFDASGAVLGISDAMAMLPEDHGLLDTSGKPIPGGVLMPSGISLMIPANSFCAEVRAEFHI